MRTPQKYAELEEENARQKDEIEGLIVAQETLQKYIAKLNKELERANIENEKSKASNAEVIKKFTKSLKKRADYCYLGYVGKLAYRITAKDLNNLVKEMAGDTE